MGERNHTDHTDHTDDSDIDVSERGRDRPESVDEGGDVSLLGGLEVELLAASLRADTSDMQMWIAMLGTKLAGALPQRVRLQRSGVFSNGAVKSMEIELGAWRLALRLEHGYPLAERTHVVRGIALKTEQLPLDSWVSALCQGLADLAAASAREHAAIESLLT
jgi:hypothetical protein